MKVSNWGWSRGSPIPFKTRESILDSAGVRDLKTVKDRSPSEMPLSAVCLMHMGQKRLQRVVTSATIFVGVFKRAGETGLSGGTLKDESLLISIKRPNKKPP